VCVRARVVSERVYHGPSVCDVCVCEREMMLFIGTRFSNLYNAVDTPA